jgi:hypothetical protein
LPAFGAAVSFAGVPASAPPSALSAPGSSFSTDGTTARFSSRPHLAVVLSHRLGDVPGERLRDHRVHLARLSMSLKVRRRRAA